MDIVMITASPRMVSQSNTARIAEEFCAGALLAGASIRRYTLSEKSQWFAAKQAFLEGKCILFVLPLYNGMVPGSMMEFLQDLSQEPSLQNPSARKIAYILQSGFPEACQRRCCEEYLQLFTQYLNCCFAGVLSHGNTFNMRFTGVVEETHTYEQMGALFVQAGGSFLFREAENFTGPEHITREEARVYNRVFRFFCERTAEAKGCAAALDHRPYHTKN